MNRNPEVELPESKPDGQHIIETTKLLAPGLLLGVAYGVGFVIVNATVGQYHSVQYQLFRSQYVAAAILFVFMTGVPLLLGMVIGRDYHSDELILSVGGFRGSYYRGLR